MSGLKIQPEITLRERRCFKCGRYWAAEETGNWNRETGSYDFPECPFCAERDHKMFFETRSGLDRTIAALKGQVTRLKRKAKR